MSLVPPRQSAPCPAERKPRRSTGPGPAVSSGATAPADLTHRVDTSTARGQTQGQDGTAACHRASPSLRTTSAMPPALFAFMSLVFSP